MHIEIDVTFDFRSDSPEGRDPDVYSKTLRRYHKLLWSKRLPRGELFGLSDKTPGKYLHHCSSLGNFALSSDTVIPTFRWTKLVKELIPAEELESFRAVVNTVGGMMIFPANRVEKKWTINQARGCMRNIGDRFDLTLECILRHYRAAESPMTAVLTRYSQFFDLFSDFQGYVEFFLLQDFVSAEFSTVKFHAPFDDFRGCPIPTTVDGYMAYKTAAIALIKARNSRILQRTAAGA